MNYYDTIIIGAGGAGLMCAITSGKRGRKVLLLDHARVVGAKIRISGGGRCNFTNINTTQENYLSNNPQFCISALKRFMPQDFIKLVQEHNIAYHEKTLGQQFCNESSRCIIKMLLQECYDNKVEIKLETFIRRIEKCEEIFEVQTQKEILKCKSLVIATGGLSMPGLGATNFGYNVAKQFGIKIVKARPGLVPFTLNASVLKHTINLAGISLNAEVTCNNKSFQEAMLFTHKGLSGPVILQISLYWEEGDRIVVNLLPEINIFEYLQKKRSQNSRQEIQTLLANFLPRKLANYIVENTHCGKYLAELSNTELEQIGESINKWIIYPNGTEGFTKAEVTLGGIDTSEVSSRTFESNKISGLYFIGEVLDVTGHLGGYNFQWAWASGNAAGQFV